MRFLSLLALLLALTPHVIAGPIVPLASDGATVSSSVDGVCAGCTVEDEANAISDDLEAFAVLRAFVGVSGSVSLRVTFPDEMRGGSKAGFRIGTGGLLDVGVLSGLTVTTYLDGVERVSGSGGALLSLQLLDDDTGRVMLRSRKSFDEVRIEMGGLISVDRDLRVYHAVIVPKRATRTVTEIPLASAGATLDHDAGGVVCVPIIAPCEVTDAAHVIADDTNAYATMSLPVGIGAWAWVDVTFAEVNDTRRKAGFVIRDGGGLLDLELLSTLTLTTYLGGEVQESASGASALRLVSLGATKKAVYFDAREPFDRLRITTAGLASVGVQVRVYHAAVQYTERVPAATLSAPAPTASLRSPEVLTAPAPNPTTGLAALAVQLDEPQHVRVDVFDARGRLVQTPFEGRVETSASVSVDARRLPAGVYAIRATGETFAATRRLTVAR